MYSQGFILLAFSVIAYGAPNHLKTVVVEKQAPGNGVAFGSLGASANWGGYSASAGLGGSAGGGGLYAGASAPEGSASAGLGGSSSVGASASAGASAGGVGVSKVGGGGGFFDNIFNIPISVLKSVNHHLNTQGKSVSVHGGGSAAGSGATASASADAGGGFKSAGDAGVGGSAGGTVTVRKNYDSAFAIPIAALTSVNHFLNGKK